MTSLKPFWHYYGGKYRAAPRYPTPKFDTIVEPFAGAAGYACRYPDRDVVLLDVYPVIAEMWRYLISVPAAEILRIPEVESVHDLPSWCPPEARSLVGFWMQLATYSPRVSLSPSHRRQRAAADANRKYRGWTPAVRERVASQVERIRHWRVACASFDTFEPDIPATYFVDPPYNNKAGARYVHSSVDYAALASWCRRARGQVIACENEGATWLPFRSFYNYGSALRGKETREVIWTGGMP